MWYDSLMEIEQVLDHLKQAETAVTHARSVRELHRRRSERGSHQREQDIQYALDRIKTAMRPLRSEIGRFVYGPQTTVAEETRQRIREASEALQKERRKLWKMKDRRKNVQEAKPAY